MNIKEAIRSIQEAYNYHIYEVDYKDDWDNYEGFLNSCRDELDFLIGYDNLEFFLDLVDNCNCTYSCAIELIITYCFKKFKV